MLRYWKAATDAVPILLRVEAVRLGKQAAKSQWTLGDLALTVETEYGEGKLQDYADDIQVSYQTLKQNKWVASRYEKVRRRTDSGDLGYGVACEFAAQEDRLELIANPPTDEKGKVGWTVRAARAFVQERADEEEGDDDAPAPKPKPRPKPDDDDDDDDDEEEDETRLAFMRMTMDVYKIGEVSRRISATAQKWNVMTPRDKNKLDKVIEDIRTAQDTMKLRVVGDAG